MCNGRGALPPAEVLKRLPAFCRVAATLRPSSDSDIKIEVWLPLANWNGKFQGVGNGGLAGFFTFTAGNGGLERGMAEALNRGYATASTDAGHAGDTVEPLLGRQSTIDCYERMRAVTGAERIGEWARLFLAPGMGHCGGGAGQNVFDPVAALEPWVEHGRAPEAMIATHATDGKVDRTRPLCPYPQVATYNDTGSIDEAASFTCRLQ